MSLLKDRTPKQSHTDARRMVDEIHESHVANLDGIDEIADYFLDNGVLLDSYYKGLNNQTETRDGREGGILGILHKSIRNEAQPSESSDKEPVENSTDNLSVNQREQEIRKYLSNVDDTYLDTSFHDHQYDRCIREMCGSQMEISVREGTLTCPTCGYTVDILIESERGPYNEPPKESNYFAYKRINHFNEWLAQFQAKETSEIPEEVYRAVHRELQKDIFLDWTNIKYETVRDTLKKLKYNKFYEQIPHIVNVLTGKDGPILDRQLEETLRSLFKEIQLPFIRNCPETRKNFLSYSYVLHKFCQLLDHDDLLLYFPLLKSREKLQQQDMIWKKICKDLEWQYIPST
jgi:uncharacterized Zn finger protein (UPF0148 family)